MADFLPATVESVRRTLRRYSLIDHRFAAPHRAAADRAPLARLGIRWLASQGKEPARGTE